MNEQAIAGMKLFNSNRLNCIKCHSWEQPFKNHEANLVKE
jgi:cytochrome c peroxidase